MSGVTCTVPPAFPSQYYLQVVTNSNQEIRVVAPQPAAASGTATLMATTNFSDATSSWSISSTGGGFQLHSPPGTPPGCVSCPEANGTLELVLPTSSTPCCTLNINCAPGGGPVGYTMSPQGGGHVVVNTTQGTGSPLMVTGDLSNGQLVGIFNIQNI